MAPRFLLARQSRGHLMITAEEKCRNYWRNDWCVIHIYQELAGSSSGERCGAIVEHIEKHPVGTTGIDHGSQSCANDMLGPSRIRMGSIKVRMAGFELREKDADAFLEGF